MRDIYALIQDNHFMGLWHNYKYTLYLFKKSPIICNTFIVPLFSLSLQLTPPFTHLTQFSEREIPHQNETTTFSPSLCIVWVLLWWKSLLLFTCFHFLFLLLFVLFWWWPPPNWDTIPEIGARSLSWHVMYVAFNVEANGSCFRLLKWVEIYFCGWLEFSVCVCNGIGQAKSFQINWMVAAAATAVVCSSCHCGRCWSHNLF